MSFARFLETHFTKYSQTYYVQVNIGLASIRVNSRGQPDIGQLALLNLLPFWMATPLGTQLRESPEIIEDDKVFYYRWYGIQCKAFHICEAFENTGNDEEYWDDCDDPGQGCPGPRISRLLFT